MRSIRVDDIERYVLDKGFVPMEELCARFAVSINTVRRDVAQLIQRGALEKVYGGVSSRRSGALTPYHVRTIRNEEGKKRVGALAAEMVKDGDVIFIDSGTTTLHMAEGLREKRNVTAVTYNLPAVAAFMQLESLNVIVLPGQICRDTNSLTGPDTASFLGKYNIDIAFMAASGVSEDGGVTNSSPLEYEIKMRALAQSKRAYLLVDQAKFGHSGLLTYARLNAFASVLTDELPGECWHKLVEDAGARLVVPGRE